MNIDKKVPTKKYKKDIFSATLITSILREDFVNKLCERFFCSALKTFMCRPMQKWANIFG